MVGGREKGGKCHAVIRSLFCTSLLDSIRFLERDVIYSNSVALKKRNFIIRKCCALTIIAVVYQERKLHPASHEFQRYIVHRYTGQPSQIMRAFLRNDYEDKSYERPQLDLEQIRLSLWLILARCSF